VTGFGGANCDFRDLFFCFGRYGFEHALSRSQTGAPNGSRFGSCGKTTRPSWGIQPQMASQSLLSSRICTGQGENLFLGQGGLAGQPIQFTFIGEQFIKETRGFRGGQAADFLKHFSR